MVVVASRAAAPVAGPYETYFEVELRDADSDFPVALGEVGEIMVRPRIAHGFMAGYQGQSQNSDSARSRTFLTAVSVI